ncbi:MAG: hypothetical protein HC876_01810 [Chloroflexaceae bacterium]|nr:hypothetical protein [Chloroflexaceae bacterium]NJO04359.1 hypothetical protein [Chloroflexaceae bacterium]
MSDVPWYGGVSATSPDGHWHAAIEEAYEIAMGAPTAGTLELSDGRTFDWCNPALVWSSDSRYLAIPQWAEHGMQLLLVISMDDGRHGYMPELYRVLALETFEDGIIRGIDSPIFQPVAIAVPVANVVWAA